MNNINSKIWAIVPAAGSGKRLGADKPKQYLILCGKPILAHTLNRLITHPLINRTVVVLGADDGYWPSVHLSLPGKVLTTVGAIERHRSVYQGLLALQAYADGNDWVLVHDAVRPCLRHEHIDRLIHQLGDHPVGGLLGVKIRDTLKRIDQTGQVLNTLDRTAVWQAQTPQMFRYGLLFKALQAAIAQGKSVTDEAEAIELLGQQPLMIEGCIDNIKITYPEDLSRVQCVWDSLNKS